MPADKTQTSQSVRGSISKMVSLLNYKTVDTELQQVPVPDDGHLRGTSVCKQKLMLDTQKAGDRFFAHVMRYESRQTSQQPSSKDDVGRGDNESDSNVLNEEQTSNAVIICDEQSSRGADSSKRTKAQTTPTALEVNAGTDTSLAISRSQDNPPNQSTDDVVRADTKPDLHHNGSTKDTDADINDNDSNSERSSSENHVCTTSDDIRIPDFVVTWRNLNFVIEPKWHQKLANSTRTALSNTKQPSKVNKEPPSSVESPGTLAADGFESAVRSSTVCQPRVVLDKLDGSFKSGELTAILGPSGKYGWDVHGGMYLPRCSQLRQSHTYRLK